MVGNYMFWFVPLFRFWSTLRAKHDLDLVESITSILQPWVLLFSVLDPLLPDRFMEFDDIVIFTREKVSEGWTNLSCTTLADYLLPRSRLSDVWLDFTLYIRNAYRRPLPICYFAIFVYASLDRDVAFKAATDGLKRLDRLTEVLNCSRIFFSHFSQMSQSVHFRFSHFFRQTFCLSISLMNLDY